MSKSYRVWSHPENKYVTHLNTAQGVSPIYIRLDGHLEAGSEKLNDRNYTLERNMHRGDKNGVEIFEGDIVEVEMEGGGSWLYVVKFGKTERTVYSGNLVEINGFHFQNYFKGHEIGTPRFSIVNNFKLVHDLAVTFIVGNIHENFDLLAAAE